MSAASKLIVNADDFGIAEAVNRGIVEAYDRGIVTSTSIMATGPAFEHAVALARSCGRDSPSASTSCSRSSGRSSAPRLPRASSSPMAVSRRT